MFFSFWLALTPWATGDEVPKVTITGGADASGHHYAWMVTNEHTSALVRIEFPQHHADLFVVPEGWTGQTTPHACTAESRSSVEGIAPGRTQRFQLRVGPAGAQRGRSEVRVRFADGTTAAVAGVEVPAPESAGDKYVPLIGLAVVFLLLIADQVRRGRRSRRGSSPHGGAPAG